MPFRMLRTIVLRGTGVTGQFASNGCCPFERMANCRYTETSLSHACYRDPVVRLKLLVGRMFLNMHSLIDKLKQFIFEIARHRES
jgi:hypothetical protein